MKNLLTTSLALFAMTAFILSGCADSPDNSQFSEVSSTDSEHPTETPHAHPSEGPHGGDLIELGNEEYHAELVHPHGHDGDGITIYILDSSATKVVAIEAAEITLNLTHDGKPEQFKLAAMPEQGDPEGKSSRFASADKDLLEHFHEEAHVDGTLVLSIDGKSYRGKLAHQHGDDDHHRHGAEEHGSGHSHVGGDALVWKGEPRKDGDLQILVGHHGKHLHAGETVEPAVSITRNGRPVADLKVFNSLLSADGKSVLAEEVATVFEPATDDEPAHYAQGALAIPKGVDAVIIRYRISKSESVDVTFEIPIMFE